MGDAQLKDARILIVDDQLPNIRVLERLLQQNGYTSLYSTTDSREVVRLYAEVQADLILLDLHMPHLDGFAVLEQLRTVIPAESYLPILVVTADITPAAKRQALEMGAKDFLTKPFDTTEVLLRIRNLLETRYLHRQITEQNEHLEEKVHERTQQLEQAQLEILQRLAQAAEFRDDDTGQHTQRVGRISARLAQILGLPEARVELIRMAAPLHDVGKIGVPDGILLKPGKLEPQELTVMRRHTTIGAKLLSGSHHPLLQLAETIALTHHERWDGTGYPSSLQGEAIPLAGRIVAIADVFDALTHERPYKVAWSVDQAMAEIERQSGRQFDPRVAEAFLRLWREQGRARQQVQTEDVVSP